MITSTCISVVVLMECFLVVLVIKGYVCYDIITYMYVNVQSTIAWWALIRV